MIGWLADTNVIASLIAPNGAPSVKGWGRAVDERRLFISILTLADYDKGISNLAGDDPNVQRYIAARDALEADLYLVSRNTKDLHHCGAAVFDPWRDDIAAFPLKPPRRR